MDSTDQLYQDFLGELDTLERFRRRYQEIYKGTPLDRDDPDVRRLIESMAFFSVQTRHATQHNLRSTWLRLFSSFFDFLLEPLPAAALVQALPTAKMTEAVRLPRGTELRLSPSEGLPGSFRLQRDFRVLPVTLEQADVVPLADGGHRLILRFVSAAGSRKDLIGPLSLHVRHLDEYRSSLAVYHSLRKHLEKVLVVYDAQASESSDGPRCGFSFGTPPLSLDDAANVAHPLQRVRSFFQLPEQGLFLHVEVPPHQGEWNRFSLCLDLKKEWKVGRSPHPEILHPFVAPVVNLKAEPAQLLSVDGTRSEFPLLSLSGRRELRLHSVTGVYELTETGRSAMRPAYLPGEGPSYELDEELTEDLTSRHRLLVRMPEAFTEPRKILVEALWYQPQFATQATGRISVSTPSRHIEGLGWQMMGGVQPNRDSPLRNDVAGLTRLLSWKVKPTLERDELLALLSYLGTPMQSPFRPIIPWLRKLEASILPDSALKGSGLRHVYEVLLESFDSGAEPLVACLLEQIQELLDAWSGEAAVELKPTVAGAGPFQMMRRAP